MHNIVSFAVSTHANKLEIKSAVEALFDVKVIDVRTSRGPRKDPPHGQARWEAPRLEEGSGAAPRG